MRVYTGSLIILKDLRALYSFSEAKHPFIVIYNIIIYYYQYRKANRKTTRILQG